MREELLGTEVLSAMLYYKRPNRAVFNYTRLLRVLFGTIAAERPRSGRSRQMSRSAAYSFRTADDPSNMQWQSIEDAKARIGSRTELRIVLAWSDRIAGTVHEESILTITYKQAQSQP